MHISSFSLFFSFITIFYFENYHEVDNNNVPTVILIRWANDLSSNHYLTLSWRRSPSYGNKSIDLLCRSMRLVLYDGDLH